MKKSKEKQDFATPEGKKWLTGLLRDEEVTVFFEKKDGSMREMHCTLIENKIPNEKKPLGSGKSKNDEVLPVFDVEKQEWRSFRFDSVRKIEFSLGGNGK